MLLSHEQSRRRRAKGGLKQIRTLVLLSHHLRTVADIVDHLWMRLVSARGAQASPPRVDFTSRVVDVLLFVKFFNRLLDSALLLVRDIRAVPFLVDDGTDPLS